MKKNRRTPRLLMFIADPLRELVPRAAFLTLVAVSVGLIGAQRLFPAARERLDVFVYEPTSAVLAALSLPARVAQGLAEEVVTLVTLTGELNRLRSELHRKAYLEARVGQLQAENAKLRRIVRFDPKDVVFYRAARIVSGSSGVLSRRVLLDIGSRQGVRKGQAAIANHVLVGVVTSTSPTASRLALVDDPNVNVPVVENLRREPGILRGTGTPGVLTLELVSAVQHFGPGDRLVTSGLGGVFPADITVAVVTEVRDDKVFARSVAELDRLETVLVVDYAIPGLLFP